MPAATAVLAIACQIDADVAALRQTCLAAPAATPTNARLARAAGGPAVSAVRAIRGKVEANAATLGGGSGASAYARFIATLPGLTASVGRRAVNGAIAVVIDAIADLRRSVYAGAFDFVVVDMSRWGCIVPASRRRLPQLVCCGIDILRCGRSEDLEIWLAAYPGESHLSGARAPMHAQLDATTHDEARCEAEQGHDEPSCLF